jgi:hypothetical protein
LGRLFQQEHGIADGSLPAQVTPFACRWLADVIDYLARPYHAEGYAVSVAVNPFGPPRADEKSRNPGRGCGQQIARSFDARASFSTRKHLLLEEERLIAPRTNLSGFVRQGFKQRSPDRIAPSS